MFNTFLFFPCLPVVVHCLFISVTLHFLFGSTFLLWNQVARVRSGVFIPSLQGGLGHRECEEMEKKSRTLCGLFMPTLKADIQGVSRNGFPARRNRFPAHRNLFPARIA